MKKSLIITVGVILILVVLGIWGYLLFFGTPENSDDVFANLGFGGQPVTIVEQEPITLPEEDLTQLGSNTEALRQLTTKPVAGFGFVGTSSELIRYVERGTGHIFEINTTDGTERRVSGTTIPRVVDATFSPDGRAVALSSEGEYTRSIVAGVIDEENSSVNYINLPINSFDPGFVGSTKLNYAVTVDGGTEGYQLDVRANEPVRQFFIPLRDVTMLWGDDNYVYNRPTTYFPGSLYEVGSTISPVTTSGYSFVGGINNQYYFVSQNENGVLNSYAIDDKNDTRIQLAVSFVPEKCTAVITNSELLWCSAPFDTLDSSFLENWYQGTVQSSDNLWLVNISGGEAELKANFLSEAGRLVDVDMIVVNESGEVPIFRNKVDNTLWLYDSRLD